MPHTQEYVYFNDGKNENVHALVVADHGGGNLNLFLPDEATVKTSVPHREKADYDSSGGGYTWHE